MKGLLFSIILFFITLFILSSFLYYGQISMYYTAEKAVENRIKTMVKIIEDVFEDSKRAMSIVTNRAIVSAVNYVIINGVGLNSANETIKELILFSSIDGNKQPLMENSNINDWIATMEYLISLYGFESKIQIKDLKILPYDSFTIEVIFSLEIFLSDRKIETNITKEKNFRVLVSIENIEDPLYPLNTYGRVVNVIRRSPNWPKYYYDNTTNLLDDMSNSYYNPSLNGASFFDRLEGKYFVQEKYRRENIIGLESFVNKEKIELVGLPVRYNQTNIDYLYFSNFLVQSFKVYGMPDNFRLDNETTINNKTHLQIYNVSVIT
ncbi:MAG: hypothetical protein QXW01_02090 [Candidatus Aenigmatarchaeota archaeon]